MYTGIVTISSSAFLKQDSQLFFRVLQEIKVNGDTTLETRRKLAVKVRFEISRTIELEYWMLAY